MSVINLQISSMTDLKIVRVSLSLQVIGSAVSAGVLAESACGCVVEGVLEDRDDGREVGLLGFPWIYLVGGL